MGQDNLVISILAGKKTATIAQELQYKSPIVRAMPNIAAVIGQAATAMCCNEAAESSHRQLAEQIFAAVGEAYWTKETLMDTVTGLSGSGPAYIYMVIEALADGGLKMGMPRELALKLATQTVLGSAAMVKATGLHPAILKDQVTTPAGTTISALHELEERGLRSMFVSAVEKATLRSQELGKNE
ncbi:MAG: pyrroline-5-carboxylate reductase [Proteobacteria bacterium]|nr:pyrroline-5-carboxylate reductase [Pseudomonadota bacterium]